MLLEVFVISYSIKCLIADEVYSAIWIKEMFQINIMYEDVDEIQI